MDAKDNQANGLTTASRISDLHGRLRALDDSLDANRLGVAKSEDALIEALDQGGLLEAFLAQAAKAKGALDHYRDTPLSGSKTTGSEVDAYLRGPLNIALNDANHFSPRQAAEALARDSMREAHGESASAQPHPPKRVSDPVTMQAEQELFDFRQQRTTHAIAMKGHAALARGMGSRQGEFEGVKAPAKPKLSEPWRAAVASEAVSAAMGKSKGAISRDWPASLKGSAQTKLALDAMMSRHRALASIKEHPALAQKLNEDAQRAFAAHADALMPDLEANARAGMLPERQAKALDSADPAKQARADAIRAQAGSMREAIANIGAGSKAAREREFKEGGRQA